MKKHPVKQVLVKTNKSNNKYTFQCYMLTFLLMNNIIDDMNIFLSTQFIQFLLISPVRKQEGIFPFIRSEQIVPNHLLKALLVLGTEEKVSFENYC